MAVPARASPRTVAGLLPALLEIQMDAHKYFPPVDDLLQMEEAEIASYLLFFLRAIALPSEAARSGGRRPFRPHQFNPANDIRQDNALKRYAEQSGRPEEVFMALLEAWAWLMRECYLVPAGMTNGTIVILGRRARAVEDRTALEALHSADLLPRGRLHPALPPKVRTAFVRGDYETAIFQAMREVEIRVRAAIEAEPSLTGVKLMRDAFDKQRGVLADRDPAVADGERDAWSHLFAGAIGSLRNPVAHRNVDISDPVEAAEIISFASFLLRVVDRREADAGEGEGQTASS